MRSRLWILVLGILCGLTAQGRAQMIGSPLPAPSIHDLAGGKARQFGEFEGRLVMLEFFAYW